MSHASMEVHQDDPIHKKLDDTRSLTAIVDAFSAGKHLSVVLHPVASTRRRFLDRLTSALRLQNARVIRVASPEGKPLDLQELMEQIVSPDEQEGVERI